MRAGSNLRSRNASRAYIVLRHRRGNFFQLDVSLDGFESGGGHLRPLGSSPLPDLRFAKTNTAGNQKGRIHMNSLIQFRKSIATMSHCLVVCFGHFTNARRSFRHRTEVIPVAILQKERMRCSSLTTGATKRASA